MANISYLYMAVVLTSLVKKPKPSSMLFHISLTTNTRDNEPTCKEIKPFQIWQECIPHLNQFSK